MSPTSSPDIPSSEPAVLFRPSKKRKIYRQRAASPSPDAPPSVASPVAPAPQSLDELISSTAQDVEAEAAEVDIGEILRMRKQRRGKGGVEFRAGKANASSMKETQELVVREEHVEGGLEETSGGGVVRKFAAQTGTVGDVNKHMMAYIDSEIAKRRMGELQISGLTTVVGDARPTSAGKGLAEVNRQPAALGKLHEIDLGDEARDKNVARTDMATRRLNGEEVVEESAQKKPTKVRLGRDGKPWRGKKRRGSDDIRRDQLVDEILRENKLDIYDSLSENEAGPGDDQAADDRIAEAFRKEFMDSVAARQRKQKVGPPAPTRTAGGKKEEVLQGPKLGGSRSARAAMRETMLKAAKK